MAKGTMYFIKTAYNNGLCLSIIENYLIIMLTLFLWYTAITTVPFSRQVTSMTIKPQVTLPNNRHSVVVGGNEAEREACRDIHCDFDATCELGPDNFPRCSCHFDCLSAMGENGGRPVCASDMRIYTSICVMKMEGCQRQEELRLRPLDLCEGKINQWLEIWSC